MRNTKIRILASTNAIKLCYEVNEFLETHDVIDVQYQPVLIKLQNDTTINNRVMIVYVDDGE